MVLSIQSIHRWTDSFPSKQTKPKGCPPVGAALSLLGHGIVEPGHDGRLDALEKVPDGMVSEVVSLLHGLVAVDPVGPVRSALLGEPRGVAKQGVSLSNVDLAMRREVRWGESRENAFTYVTSGGVEAWYRRNPRSVIPAPIVKNSG